MFAAFRQHGLFGLFAHRPQLIQFGVQQGDALSEPHLGSTASAIALVGWLGKRFRQESEFHDCGRAP
jgi:hypothetical protein